MIAEAPLSWHVIGYLMPALIFGAITAVTVAFLHNKWLKVLTTIIGVLLILWAGVFMNGGMDQQWEAKQQRLRERDACIERGGQPLYTYYRGSAQKYIGCAAKG